MSKGRNLFCVRHGETEWSLSGQHTGTTDIPLTDNGRQLAKRLVPPCPAKILARARQSLQRARETCALAGLNEQASSIPTSSSGIMGIRRSHSTQIHGLNPGWIVFRDGCPGGETPAEVGDRVDRVIERALKAEGDVALFAHGHVLRTWRRAGRPPPEKGSGSCSTLARCASSVLPRYPGGEGLECAPRRGSHVQKDGSPRCRLRKWCSGHQRQKAAGYRDPGSALRSYTPRLAHIRRAAARKTE